MRQSLIHFWRINLAVILGAAVATAVLTGALLVGDSVRGSLRQLTLDRLGNIDYLLVANEYLREDLVFEFQDSNEFRETFAAAAPAIIMNGTTVHAETRTRASHVNILGVAESFLALYGAEAQAFASLLKKEPGQIFSSVIINQSLQNELQAEIGAQILVSFEKPGEVARGTILGSKDTEDVVETVRLTLTGIVPNKGVGRFSLRPHQTLPLNAYVALPILQKALGQGKRVNAFAVAQQSDPESNDASGLLQARLREVLKFEDLGLKLTPGANSLILASKTSILSQQVVRLAESVADEIGAPTLVSYTYLANKMAAHGRLLPYSTVAALNPPVAAPFKPLRLLNGRPASALAPDEILLNQWAAADLGVAVGDSIAMTYFAVGARDELFTQQAKFVLRGIVAMAGLAADPSLTPDFPGIADADNMADWDPPFAVDLRLIRPKDEAYWDAYRGTPKAFVALETGQRLWGSRFGNVTSIRIAPAPGMSLHQTGNLFKEKLLAAASPEQFDLAFQPVKAQGLASSAGATDFSGLFVGFSLFLIVSAALLVGLLFRLGVEQRAKEIGMLLAVGYRQKKVGGQLLAEGGFLAAVGALVGLAGAVLYAWLMMAGLRTWWVAAVGSPFLFLHVKPLSLITGYLISVLVILLSIWLAFRKMSKVSPPALLAGVTTFVQARKSTRKARIVASVSTVLALVLVAVTLRIGVSDSAELFFGVGALLLTAGLALFSVWLHGAHKPLAPGKGAGVLRMGARNSPRNPGRSMLSAALVASACFVIVAVGANRVDFGSELQRKDSGTGGFALVAQADIPLHHDLSSEAGRFALGFSDSDSDKLKDAQIMPFRLLPGDDASCLNLYAVEKPRILGVPKAQRERGGFRFQQLLQPETNGDANPWRLLNQDLGPDVIPAFGDYNSVLWILHSGLGKDLLMTDAFGRQIKLRFVGLLKKSIFQSELLISEENFLKHFPARTGYSFYLIATPPDQIEALSGLLERTLSDYGFDTATTAERLANFQAVENTYLSTFQTLGGLGLLLGTLGLGMILIRNVIERRGELATLRAFGFRRATLALMVVAENGFLLAFGILIGSVSALIAVAPHVFADAGGVPWVSLLSTLTAVFLVGMLASVVAVSSALRIPLLPALRAE